MVGRKGFVLLLSVATAASAAAPCCAVTAFNAKTGEVTVKEGATGRLITLKIAPLEPTNGAKLNKTFKLGSKLVFRRSMAECSRSVRSCN